MEKVEKVEKVEKAGKGAGKAGKPEKAEKAEKTPKGAPRGTPKGGKGRGASGGGGGGSGAPAAEGPKSPKIPKAARTVEAVLEQLGEYQAAVEAATSMDKPSPVTAEHLQFLVWSYGVEAIMDALEDEWIRGVRSPARMSVPIYAKIVHFQYQLQKHAEEPVKVLLEVFQNLVAESLTLAATRLEEAVTAGLAGQAFLQQFVRRWEVHVAVTKFLVTVFQFADPVINHQSVFLTNGPTPALTAVPGPGNPAPQVLKKQASLLASSYRSFCNKMFKGHEAALVVATLALDKTDRSGEPADRPLLRSAVSMLATMSLCLPGDPTGKVEFYINNVRNASDLSVRLRQPLPPPFREKFEKPMHDMVTDFYSKRANELLSRGSVEEYLHLVGVALDTELQRVMATSPTFTVPPVLNAARAELLAAKSADILAAGSGLPVLLHKLFFDVRGDDTGAGGEEGRDPALVKKKLGDIKRLFYLFRGTPSSTPALVISPVKDLVSATASAFYEFIVSSGKTVVTRRSALAEAAAEGPDGKKKPVDLYDPDYVTALGSLLDSCKRILVEAFDSVDEFENAFKRGMEKVMNSDSNHPSILALFIDGALRGKRGKNCIAEAQVDEAVAVTLRLLVFLADKDRFRERYTNLLSKRLLLNKSLSEDVEKMALGRLKVLCGPQYTEKVERMMGDLSIARESDQVYRAHLKDRGSLSAVEDYGVTLLKNSYWSGLNRLKGTILPSPMKECVAHFEAYYKQLQPKKIVDWVLGYGSATVTVQFPHGWKNLQVTTLQAAILLVFNVHPTATVGQMADLLKIEMGTLRSLLGSMCNVPPPVRVLKKTPRTPKIDSTDVLELDPEFKNAKRELTLVVPQLGGEKEENQGVAEERKVVVDAVIVRILKARKRIDHKDLVAEVMQQSRFFRPDGRLIKQRVEYLIGQRYARREDATLHTSPYVYIPADHED